MIFRTNKNGLEHTDYYYHVPYFSGGDNVYRGVLYDPETECYYIEKSGIYWDITDDFYKYYGKFVVTL